MPQSSAFDHEDFLVLRAIIAAPSRIDSSPMLEAFRQQAKASAEVAAFNKKITEDLQELQDLMQHPKRKDGQ